MFEYERVPEKASETKAARIMGEALAKKVGARAPVDVRKVMEEECGMSIQELELSASIAALVDLDQKSVILNTKQHKNRSRFTLAHELGHIKLNHSVRKWTEYGSSLSSNPDQPLEEEANAFASGFLMPSYLLKEFIKDRKTPREMAQLLEVSEEALWYSLQTNKLVNKLLG